MSYDRKRKRRLELENLKEARDKTLKLVTLEAAEKKTKAEVD
jgi:hypothetical protein